MTRLLTVVDFICGCAACHRVFEPLLADWQRELRDARSHGVMAYATASMKGAFGFAGALAVCAVTEGVWIPPLRALIRPLAAIIVTLAISLGVILIAPLPLQMPRDLSIPFVQQWLLIWSVILTPPVFLLAMYLLRRDARTTFRHATVLTVLAAAATGVLVANTTEDALRRRFDTFEANERMREISLARHRAGQRVYRGTGYQDEVKLTLAQRRARFDRSRALMAKYRYDPPTTWRSRLEQISPILLSIVFAIMGWTLARLGTTTLTRGAAWWALVFVATIAMTRILSNLVGVPMPRPPEWTILPIFGSIMLALVIGARRMHKPHNEVTR